MKIDRSEFNANRALQFKSRYIAAPRIVAATRRNYRGLVALLPVLLVIVGSM